MKWPSLSIVALTVFFAYVHHIERKHAAKWAEFTSASVNREAKTSASR